MFSALPFFGLRPSRPVERERSASPAPPLPSPLPEPASSSSTAPDVSPRALGKRKQPIAVEEARQARRSRRLGDTPSPATSVASSLLAPAPAPAPAPVADGKKGLEKRVTRSSLALNGGGALRSTGDDSDSENGWLPPPPLLPPTTVVLLTTKPPSPTSTKFFDPDPVDDAASIAHLGTSLHAQPSIPADDDQASFRLLDETELVAPGRTRGSSVSRLSPSHQPSVVGADSDAHFLRLHRFPEVLEKRSKRREKERLVHARFGLRATLEALRNTSDGKTVRGLVNARWREEARMGRNEDEEEGGTEGERMERTRRRMIKEVEETLKRYDALLEPRKEFHRADSVTSLSDRAASPSPSSFRGPSPLPPSLTVPNLTRHPPPTRVRARPSARQVGPTKGVVRTESGLTLKILFRGAGGKFIKSPDREKGSSSTSSSSSTSGTKRRREPSMVVTKVRTTRSSVPSQDEEPEARPVRTPVKAEPPPASPDAPARVLVQDSFFDSSAIRSAGVTPFAAGPTPTVGQRRSARVAHAFGVKVAVDEEMKEFDPTRADDLEDRSVAQLVEQRQSKDSVG